MNFRNGLNLKILKSYMDDTDVWIYMISIYQQLNRETSWATSLSFNFEEILMFLLA